MTNRINKAVFSRHSKDKAYFFPSYENYRDARDKLFFLHLKPNLLLAFAFLSKAKYSFTAALRLRESR